MSLVSDSLVPLFHLHASPSILAIGFSVVLVLSLVAAEEVEARRARPSGRAEG